jgi:hypothetical protein
MSNTVNLPRPREPRTIICACSRLLDKSRHTIPFAPATSTVSQGISVGTAVRASASRSHPCSAIASLTCSSEPTMSGEPVCGTRTRRPGAGRPPPRCFGASRDSSVGCGDRTVDTHDHRYSFPACGDLGTSRSAKQEPVSQVAGRDP